MLEAMAAGCSNFSPRTISLPITRVRTIMKSSPEVTSISQDALVLITLATEYFVQHLAELALKNNADTKSVEYGHLAEVVNKSPTLEFLTDIIPYKVKASDYMELIKDETEIDEDDYML